MKKKEILLFGATGQIGKNLIRKLSQNNYKITAVTRNIHRAGYILKTQANPGYLKLVELKNFDNEKIENLMGNCDICINLIGILYEKKKNHFKNIHTILPDLLSKKASKYKISKFIHLSALGIEEASDSEYANSKLEGEKRIKLNFKNSIILKPSIVYSVDDKFTTHFMTLLSRMPIMPLYYDGLTKFRPIHVTDLVKIIFEMVNNNMNNIVVECIGPEELTFKDIIEQLLKSINRSRLLIPLPLFIAKITAKILQILPKPLLTEDQLKLLKYNNVSSGNYKTNFDLGFKADKIFNIEINKYSYNWRSGGQYSKNNKIDKIK